MASRNIPNKNLKIIYDMIVKTMSYLEYKYLRGNSAFAEEDHSARYESVQPTHLEPLTAKMGRSSSQRAMECSLSNDGNTDFDGKSNNLELDSKSNREVYKTQIFKDEN